MNTDFTLHPDGTVPVGDAYRQQWLERVSEVPANVWAVQGHVDSEVTQNHSNRQER